MFTTVPNTMFLNHCVYNIYEANVIKTNGVTICPKIVLLKPLVLATLTLNISTGKCFSNIMFGNLVKPIGSSNMCGGNVVTPMGVATFWRKMMQTHCFCNTILENVVESMV